MSNTIKIHFNVCGRNSAGSNTYSWYLGPGQKWAINRNLVPFNDKLLQYVRDRFSSVKSIHEDKPHVMFLIMFMDPADEAVFQFYLGQHIEFNIEDITMVSADSFSDIYETQI